MLKNKIYKKTKTVGTLHDPYSIEDYIFVKDDNASFTLKGCINGPVSILVNDEVITEVEYGENFHKSQKELIHRYNSIVGFDITKLKFYEDKNRIGKIAAKKNISNKKAALEYYSFIADYGSF